MSIDDRRAGRQPRPGGGFPARARVSRAGPLVLCETERPVTIVPAELLLVEHDGDEESLQLMVLAFLDGLDPSARAAIKRRLQSVVPGLMGRKLDAGRIRSAVERIGGSQSRTADGGRNPAEQTILDQIRDSEPGASHVAKFRAGGAAELLERLEAEGLVTVLPGGQVVACERLAEYTKVVERHLASATDRKQLRSAIAAEIGSSKGFARELIGVVAARQAGWDGEDV